MGAVTPEAIAAHESVARDFAGAGLAGADLARPPACRLAGRPAQSRPYRGPASIAAPSPVERLLAPLSREARLVTVARRPSAGAFLAGLGARPAVVPLGVEGFGQSGDIPDLYRAYKLDTAAIIDARRQINLMRADPLT